MSLFQNESMTFVIVGHYCRKKCSSTKHVAKYILMIPMYYMFNNIYVYKDYETRFGIRNKPFH